MIELLRVFTYITLILTHPLEPLSIKSYSQPKTSVDFINGSWYIAPDNGIVKSVIESNNLFQIILNLDNGVEIVYSGLTKTFKKSGDIFIKNEIIGLDNTINQKTKFILMYYNKSQLFPQFINRRLTFINDSYTKLYMVADGTIVVNAYGNNSLYSFILDYYDDFGFYTQKSNNVVIPQSYIPGEPGSFSQIKLIGRNTYISYWHLSGYYRKMNDVLNQGELLAYSGNTGNCDSPRMVLYIDDDELGTDIRVIYYKEVDNNIE